MKNRKKGFTIVELVIVIAVIGILAGILIPVFSNLINDAKIASDSTLVKNINTQLAIAEELNGKNPTMYDALLDAKDAGYIVENINAKSKDNEIIWNQKTDRVALVSKDGEFIAGERAGAADYELWVISNEINEDYSTYYTGSETTINTSKGFDCGEVEGITAVNYSNGDSAQNVIIRTNNASTTLNIDDSSTGTIYHYGEAGALNIIQCHTGSYHENGSIAYAEIAKGRIVLESGAKVEEIHVNKKTDSSFDTVIIANNGGEEELPQRITRDAVTVSEETLVVKVESNGVSENVYVYADGVTGTKGSTQKVVDEENPENNQNANVNSPLGQLVLDNGASSDKAQTPAEKEAVKQEIVEEAVVEEIENNDKYVARIGTTPFESLKDAVASANANDIIEMTANDIDNENVSVDKRITINMNEKTFGGTIIVATAKNIPVTINGNANIDAVLNNGNKYYSNLYVGASGSYNLLKDFTMSGTTINWGINYNLDLGSHTLTMTYGGSDGAFEVKKDIYDGVGKLTISNGNLNFTSTSSSANAFEVYGELTLINVNVNSSCGNAAIKGEGGTYSQNCVINITNSVINSAGHGIHLSSCKSYSGSYVSTLTMSGSTILAGNIGVYANGATCSIDNCSIESNSYAIQTVSSSPASGIAANVTISGTTTITSQGYNTIDCKSGTMQISGNVNVSGGTSRTIYVQSSTLTIAGGTYNGNFGLGGSGQLTIAGGTYNGNLIDVTQAGRLLVIGETQFDELVTYSITGSNGSYDVSLSN